MVINVIVPSVDPFTVFSVWRFLVGSATYSYLVNLITQTTERGRHSPRDIYSAGADTRTATQNRDLSQWRGLNVSRLNLMRTDAR
jgi:hypothetical protein